MKKVFSIFLLLILGGMIFAQSADFVTELLKMEKATYGQVCYLTAVYRDLIDEKASPEDAVNALAKINELPKNAVSNMHINYENSAALFARIWEVKGHLLFKITNGNKRYAFKKFKKDKIVPANADPQMIPSGIDILNIFTAANAKYSQQDEIDGVSGATRK